MNSSLHLDDQTRNGKGPALKVLFVASIAGALDQFVAPLSQHLMHAGVETIGCCAGRCNPASFTRTYQLPPFRRRGPVAAGAALKRLISISQRERPAVLHLHTPPALVIGRIAAWQCGVPSIAVVHGTFLEPASWRSLVFALIEGSLARLAARTVVLNGDDFRFYRRVLPVDRLSLAPVGGIGLNQERLYSAKASPRRVAEFPSIVVLGRLTPEKNLSRVVEAFSLVRKRRPSAFLTFVGSTLPGEARWDVPTRPNVAHVPWVDDSYAVIAGADLVISASRREGFPMGVAEALALGVPTVAVSNRGTRQLARSAARGFELVPDDHAAIADAALRMIEQPRRFDGGALVERWSQRTAIEFHASLIRRTISEIRCR